MNRRFTCLAVLALLLVADAVCIKQTLEVRASLESSSLAMLLGAEGIAASVFVASSASLIRKHFARQMKPFTRRPVVAAAQA